MDSLVALIFSDETAQAVKNVEKMAESMDGGEPTTEHHSYERRDGTLVEFDVTNDSHMTYERLMQGAIGKLENGDYIVELGSEHWRDTYHYGSENIKQFWEWYELITGTIVEDKEAGFFSCSC